MDSTEIKLLREILAVLGEMRNFIRAGLASNIREVLDNTLTTEAEKLAYDLSDGKHTQAEIAMQVNVTQPTVSNWWRKWGQAGITVESTRFSGRQQKVFDLPGYGIRPKPISRNRADSE